MEVSTKILISFMAFGLIMNVSFCLENSPLLDDVAERANKFAADVFYRLSEAKPAENILVSPLSAELALAETFLGAGGSTAREMGNVLYLHENRSQFLEGHKLLIESLQSPVLKVATKLYIEQSFEVKKEFRDTARDYFLSEIEEADFKLNHEKARNNVNTWVENKTNNKIKDLLKPGTVDPHTRLVIVNALHFKDDWEIKFKSYQTYNEPFFLTPTKTVDVRMMHRTGTFNYRYNPETGSKVLELPFKNIDYGMLIVLPGKKDGLDRLIRALPSHAISYSEEREKLRPTLVSVTLPKFKIETEIEMINILKKMGIQDLFNLNNANLTGISEKRDLVVSKVIQKAFIEVNEEGTEAAASTAVVVALGASAVSISKKPEEFKADHPFLFLLMHKSTVLFAGSIKNF